MNPFEDKIVHGLDIQVMSDTKNIDLSKGVWFVYDGECPICNLAAQSLRIREAVGPLMLVNAREETNHPLYLEIVDQKLNLDEGMVLRYGNCNYHGQNALQMMALLGSENGWYNRMNARLFKLPVIASFLYPIMKLARNTLLKILGIPRLQNLKVTKEANPVFEDVFGDDWPNLPPAMKAHYAARSYSEDRVTVNGHLNVYVHPLLGLFARASGLLVPFSGENIPVRVTFKAARNDNILEFDRVFGFEGHKPVHFKSRMLPMANGEVIEIMRFGFGWRFRCEWRENKVILSHLGYVWRFLGLNIPMPFSLILGKGYAEECPVSDTEFSMWTHTKHPLFGKMFGYDGSFKITDMKCVPY